MTFAHHVVRPESLWQAWNLAPPVVLGILLAATTYGLGVVALRRGGHGPARWRVLCFYAGLVVVVGSLLSPLDALAATLFSAHMVQHLMLILIAAPLLVLGAPVVPVMVAMPRRVRRTSRSIERIPVVDAASRALMNPVVVLALHSIALWAWHLPSPYQAAVRDDVLHGLEHITFVATAMLFWALVIGGARRRRLGHGPAILLTFVTALQSAALGVVLTFASTVLYPVHAGLTEAWGLSALEDQQLAGAIMWIPGGIVYLGVMCALLAGWMRSMERPATAGGEVRP
ncbi:MAG TPA: cytochrome c oxidase assembly protein [Actinomycetota bacterium]|nr:cytochrome c oxidase assembly protein [Actinomycetota bacterium]